MLFTTHNTSLSHHGNCCTELAPLVTRIQPGSRLKIRFCRAIKSYSFGQSSILVKFCSLCKKLLVAISINIGRKKQLNDFPCKDFLNPGFCIKSVTSVCH